MRCHNMPRDLFDDTDNPMASEKDNFSAQTRLRQHLIRVALGKAPADLVIRGGRLVNVYTGEILDNPDIAVSGERIALVGDASSCIGSDTQIVDAEGAYLAPGFIDAHYHIESSRLAPWRHAQVTLPRGLTALVEDPHEACAPGGLDAIRYFLENTEGLPQKVYVQVPSATPPTNVETTGGYIGGEEFKEALKWPRVMGLGEMMDPPRIFGGDWRVWSLIQEAIEAGQPIEGHGGFSGDQLAAYASAGIQSTHSPHSPEQALEMLRQGFTIQLKVEREIPTIKRLLESQIDWSRVGLAVDDRPVEKLLELGSLDYEVRLVIEAGIPPIRAYQMATINNARHWRLDRDHGGIAPGRYADILVVSDLEKVTIDRVFANGREVARNGKLIIPLEGLGNPNRLAPGYALNTVRLAREVTADDFRVAAASTSAACGPQRQTQEFCDIRENAEVHALVIPPFYFSGDIDPITRTLPVRNGFVELDPATGINKVAILERHHGTGNIGLGFWHWGFQKGAIAMSVLHDSHNISVVGANDHDMAVAVNRVAKIQGGIVVVENGKVLAELPLPIFGLMSGAPPEEVAELSRAVEKAGASLRSSKADGRGDTGTQALTKSHDKHQTRDMQPPTPGKMPRAKLSQIPPDLAKTMASKPVDVLTFAYLTCHPRRFVLTDQGIFDILDERPVPLVW
jgi:adenine deaminase